METKTNAIVVMVIALIFLIIAVKYKIKIERKIRTSAISSDERVKDIHADKG